jgi:hypothetical protein
VISWFQAFAFTFHLYRYIAAAWSSWYDAVRLYGAAAAAAMKMAAGLAAAAGRAALRAWRRHAVDDARKKREMAKMLWRWLHGKMADAFAKMRAAAAETRALSRRAAVVMQRVWVKQAFRDWAAAVAGERAHLAKMRLVFQRMLKFAQTRAFNQWRDITRGAKAALERARGGAVQVEYSSPIANLKGAWFQPLNLSSEKPVSQAFAFTNATCTATSRRHLTAAELGPLPSVHALEAQQLAGVHGFSGEGAAARAAAVARQRVQALTAAAAAGLRGVAAGAQDRRRGGSGAQPQRR